jgi:hypothetical protein
MEIQTSSAHLAAASVSNALSLQHSAQGVQIQPVSCMAHLVSALKHAQRANSRMKKPFSALLAIPNVPLAQVLPSAPLASLVYCCIKELVKINVQSR